MEENVRDVKLLTERVSVKQGSLPGAGGGGNGEVRTRGTNS